jgi:hypothetical protein
MERLDPVQTDQPIELAERPLVAIFRNDVVTGGQEVAGVETDPDAQ